MPKKETKTLYKGEWVSLVSPIDEPYEVLDEPDVVFVLPVRRVPLMLGDVKTRQHKIGIRKEVCPPYNLKDETGEKSYYTIISGKIDGKESAKDAAIRELKEESGVEYEKGTIYEVFNNLPVCKSTDMRATLILIDIDESEKEEAEGDGTEYEEKSKTIWVTWNELGDILKKPNKDFLLLAVYSLVQGHIHDKSGEVIGFTKIGELEGAMIQKIASLGNGYYSIDDSDVVADTALVNQLLQKQSFMSDEEVKDFLSSFQPGQTKNFKVKANTGVVVNLYEVDYPAPPDPNEETQELAKHLDEYKDFVSQNIFPDTHIEDIVVDERSKILGPSKKKVAKVGWREKLIISR